jgi:hypothetical protein
MKYTVIVVLLLSGFASCKQKDMTLEELKTASWSTLDKGVEYIELENGKPKSGSIHYTIKSSSDSNAVALPELFKLMRPAIHDIFDDLIYEKIPNSKRGYLKFDLSKMMEPDTLNAMAYLKDLYDTSKLENDLAAIRNIPGVAGARFVSKEMARQKYLGDGNSDWEKVLTENPLPSSIEVALNNNIIETEEFEKIKTQIETILLYCEVDIPTRRMFKGNYILEYHRD